MSSGFEVIFSLFLSVLQIPLPGFHVDSRSEPEPVINNERSIPLDGSYSARSVLFFNVEGGEIIAGTKEDEILPIASLSKIMAGYVALKYLDSADYIAFSSNALATSGFVGGFQAGETFTVKDILQASMMSSSNDAVMAVAETVGKQLGGKTYKERINLFVQEMNKEAKQIGMNNTTYRNPTGLDLPNGNPSNYSTANDLRLLIQETQKTPLLWELSREETINITSLTQAAHSLFNLNKLASRIPHFIGGKTGSTDSSGESLVLVYEKPLGSKQAFILLNASSGRRFIESERLLRAVVGVLP